VADNRKYYYLKLKENYFDDDVIMVLESMPDGIACFLSLVACLRIKRCIEHVSSQ